MASLPRVTLVFLAYNRREELRISLDAMLGGDYPVELLEVIVVDNASTDATSAMVAADFPGVQLITRTENAGISAINDGFRRAGGEYVLALDDDCYLPPDGLRRAVEAARRHEADLVSFSVRSSEDPGFRFTDAFPMGLLGFWGCAALIRAPVLAELGGYDPRIFLWANEVEFTVRLLDHGYRHLYLPEVVATHMKPLQSDGPIQLRPYRLNARHFAYTAAKLFWPRDLAEALLSLLVRTASDAARTDPQAALAVIDLARGTAMGLRHRTPVRDRRVSRLYREHFHAYAGVRLLWPLVGGGPRGSRFRRYLDDRRAYYPEGSATLQM